MNDEKKNDLHADINKEYYIGRQLGNGMNGTVYFAQHRQTYQSFAIKYTAKSDRIHLLQKEATILRQLRHSCIINYVKTQTYTGSVAVLIDFMPGGDLHSRIQKKEYFSESLSKFVFYQICKGIEYLHAQNVTHRDLKPENILLAGVEDYVLVKVSDFGSSEHNPFNGLMKKKCGTPGYFAPEIHTSQHYTNKVDIWSLGVVLYNCFTGRYPFKNPITSFSDADHYALDFSHDELKQISDEGRKIVYATLQIDDKNRPSATELTQRKWLSPYDKSIQKAVEIMMSCDR